MKQVIKGATIINEGKEFVGDVLIQDKRIERISTSLSSVEGAFTEINAEGLYLIPGCIDDQVHFREPGLTHKADLASESRAAVAGGITSYMEMPNTVPNTLTQELLQQKYDRASEVSYANYSFFMGASNDNLEEVLKTDPKTVCGVKVFMGSSTGNMLVDNRQTLDHLFSNVPMLIATHCEDEATIRTNLERAKAQFGDDIPVSQHPIIRDVDACYISSSMAVEMAKKHNTRLHILHISTGKETALFDSTLPLSQKRITSEVCVHHLWFSDSDYAEKGNFIKWNPAVKSADDRSKLWEALLNNQIDVIATDHAPHTLEEKSQAYSKAPSGGPLVQHALSAMFEAAKQGKIERHRVVEKMAHAPAICFELAERGFIREGYFADLVLVNPNANQLVTRDSLYYKCGWSPFEGTAFSHKVTTTWVNGTIVFNNEPLAFQKNVAQRLTFDRK